jgi:dTDP-glucose 4,6-dehydratase
MAEPTLLVTGAAGLSVPTSSTTGCAHPSDRVIAYDALTYAGNRANLAEVEGPRVPLRARGHL